MSKVISLLGGIDITPGRVDSTAVAALEGALEQAKAGEIAGIIIVKRHHNGVGTYHIAGTVGGYSMLGATQCALSEVLTIAKGQGEDD
jgi:hypothetical protein